MITATFDLISFSSIVTIYCSVQHDIKLIRSCVSSIGRLIKACNNPVLTTEFYLKSQHYGLNHFTGQPDLWVVLSAAAQQ